MPELIPAEPGTPDWLAARRQGVTATDIVAIIGLSHWDSPYSLFWRKLGQVGDEPDRDRLALGRALEPYVVTRWAEDHGSHIPMGGGLYRHAERPWQMATLDRIMCPAQWDDGHLCAACTPLEVKSWADADRHAWGQGELPEPHDAEWAAERSKILPAVRAQVLWQMDVMDVSAGHVGVVFLPSGEFRSYTIEHEPTYAGNGWGCDGDTCSLCADLALMRAAGAEFMRRLRLELPPPDPDSSAATLAAVRARFARVPAKQAEIDPDLYQLWCDHKHAADEIAALARGAEIKLREQAGEAAELCVDGQVVARRIISDATVKEHVRHQDYLRRVKQQGDDDE